MRDNKKVKENICKGFEDCLIEAQQVMKDRKSFWYEVHDDE